LVLPTTSSFRSLPLPLLGLHPEERPVPASREATKELLVPCFLYFLYLLYLLYFLYLLRFGTFGILGSFGLFGSLGSLGTLGRKPARPESAPMVGLVRRRAEPTGKEP
jgi:hypothetical protein